MTEDAPERRPTGDGASTRTTPPVAERILAQCIEAMEIEGDESALDRACEAHPEHADELRLRFDQLRGMGLVPSDAAEKTRPQTIGPYTVLEEIGAGGMGSVYLAEQREPVHRRVAIKLIKVGMDTAEVVRRFEAERQALARMSHPAIAQVHDAGSTADGRPYFVMEFVPGKPVTKFCEDQGLSLDDRLRLFVEICDAVQHAHQRGILHRDLKPSNILVADRDGRPMPKVIDFGIAKATSPQPEASAPATLPGQVIGTPEYMSPEQARTDGMDVDTRTDVYSLGVVLYEILCGALPFDSARLRAGGATGLQRILEEETPRAPSVRIDDAKRVTGADTETLRRRLRGELDWIVLRALEKDRERRYVSPQALAQDVERYLRHEPVHAGPPSGWYRVRKFVRRHRVGVGAAAAVFLALVSGLVVSTVYYFDAEASAKSERQARADEKAAHRETQVFFDLARNAVERMLVRVPGSQLRYVPQMSKVRRELLEEALRFYQQLADRRGADAALRLSRARAYNAVANLRGQLGRKETALQARRAGLQIAEELVVQYPHDPGYRRTRAQMLSGYGADLLSLERRDEAVSSLREALASFEDLGGSDRVDEQQLDVRHSMAEASVLLGQCLRYTDTEAMREALIRGRQLLLELRGEEPENVKYLTLLGQARSELALLLTRRGERDSARKEVQTEIEELSKFLSEQEEHPDIRTVLAQARTVFANTLPSQGQQRDAVVLLEAALADWRRLREAFPLVATYQEKLASVHGELAERLRHRGDKKAMRHHHAEAVRLSADLHAALPEATYRMHLAYARARYASALAMECVHGTAEPSDLETAVDLGGQAIEVLESMEQKGKSDWLLAMTANGLGVALLAAGKPDEAKPRLETARRVATAFVQAHPTDASKHAVLASVFLNLAGVEARRSDADAQKRRKLLEEGIRYVEKSVSIDSESQSARQTQFSLHWQLAEALLQCGELEPAGTEAEWLARQFAHPSAQLAAGRILAACAARAASPESATEFRTRAIRQLHTSLAGWETAGVGPGSSLQAVHRLADTHAALGRVHRTHGNALEGRQHLGKAVDGYRGLVREHPSKAPYLSALRGACGELLEALLDDGDAVQASKVAQRMQKWLPTDPRALYVAARALARVPGSDRSAALGLLRRVVQSDFRPSVPPLRDAAFSRWHMDSEFRAVAAELAGR